MSVKILKLKNESFYWKYLRRLYLYVVIFYKII